MNKKFVNLPWTNEANWDRRPSAEAVETAKATVGLRYDAGKLRLDLLPREWIIALGEVTTKGAEKYEDRNWERGMPWSKVWGPMLRHAFKWLGGERYDQETGCHHLAMVAWNALALMVYDVRVIGQDDLRKQNAADATRWPTMAVPVPK